MLFEQVWGDLQEESWQCRLNSLISQSTDSQQVNQVDSQQSPATECIVILHYQSEIDLMASPEP